MNFFSSQPLTRARAKNLGVEVCANSTRANTETQRKSFKRKISDDEYSLEGENPPKRQRASVDNACTQLDVVRFAIGEIIWAKIRGSPHWPAQIKSFPTHNTAEVLWFNDYRRTKVFRTKLFKFMPHFDEFAVKFQTSVGLETAAREALICFGEKFMTK